jgi:hypothetical protein
MIAYIGDVLLEQTLLAVGAAPALFQILRLVTLYR